MHLIRVQKPFDSLFAVILSRVMGFAFTIPGCTIPPEWFSQVLGAHYGANSNGMLLLAVADDQGGIHGHFLAIAEQNYGRKVGWCYQAMLDKGVPPADSHRLVTEAMGILREWAQANYCVCLGMTTGRSTKAMQRRFGFQPKFTVMEFPLED